MAPYGAILSIYMGVIDLEGFWKIYWAKNVLVYHNVHYRADAQFFLASDDSWQSGGYSFVGFGQWYDGYGKSDRNQTRICCATWP